MQVLTLNSGDPKRSQMCAANVLRELLEGEVEKISEQGEVGVSRGPRLACAHAE